MHWLDTVRELAQSFGLVATSFALAIHLKSKDK